MVVSLEDGGCYDAIQPMERVTLEEVIILLCREEFGGWRLVYRNTPDKR